MVVIIFKTADVIYSARYSQKMHGELDEIIWQVGQVKRKRMPSRDTKQRMSENHIFEFINSTAQRTLFPLALSNSVGNALLSVPKGGILT